MLQSGNISLASENVEVELGLHPKPLQLEEMRNLEADLKSKHQIQVRRDWQKRNKAKLVEIRKRHYYKHIEKCRKQALDSYYKYREKNGPKRRERDRKLNKKRREIKRKYNKQYYQEHKERLLEYQRNYAVRNPHIRAKNDAKRRGAIVGCPHVGRVIRLWRSQKTFTCFYCRKSFSRKHLHVDHVTPIAIGGKHSVDNICKACPSCNHTKCATPVGKFVTQGQRLLI